MSFSWMKPTTTIASRLLITALTLSVSLNAFAERISEGDDDSPKTAKSYAQDYSEIKEEIITKNEDIESKKDELKTAQDDYDKLKRYDNNEDGSDRLDNIYGEANCECSPKTQCSIAELLSIQAITEDQTTTWHVGKGGKGCVNTASDANGSNSASPNPNVSTRPGTTYTNKYRPGDENDDVNGTGGPKGKGDCKEYKELTNVNRADVCMAVYTYSTENKRSSGSALNRMCVAAARKCGKVKLLSDLDKYPKTIEDLKVDIAKLEKEKKKLIARKSQINKDCPHCADIANSVDSTRPNLGDYIVGGLQAVSPMVVAGIQAGSYNRYLRTSLSAYNGYLSNSLANCQSYISQGTTLGIPSSPCGNSMWSGGIAQAPGGGGGYGIYGAIGGGGVGGMYGFPGGYAAGYGSYSYGGFSGGIGQAIGSMIGGSFSPYGQMGGGYSPYGIGGGIGQMGGGYTSYGIGGGIGSAMGGGIGLYGQTYGGYPSSYGSYTSTMGYGGSYGYGVDPSYQLNQGRMAMQMGNQQLWSQQNQELQYAGQRIGQQGAYGYGGSGYGGVGGGYGYGGYGGGGYGYGYGAVSYGGAVIGNVVGSVYGMPSY